MGSVNRCHRVEKHLGNADQPLIGIVFSLRPVAHGRARWPYRGHPVSKRTFSLS